MQKVEMIPVEKIKVGEYDRRLQEQGAEIEELARSIQRIGIVCPLGVVRENDNYVLICGHRRLEAARICRLENVPCIVWGGSPRDFHEVSFAENFFRKDLSPVEQATAIKDCIENKVLTIEELARGFHRSEYWVREQIAICEWPSDVLESLHQGAISVSAAHNLAVIDDSVYRGFLLRQAIENGATARTTAAWLQAWRSMLPPEQALASEPVKNGHTPAPLTPQAPCICCGNVLPMDRLSHVPVCTDCVKVIIKGGI